jgi:uncharacterized protein (TIGR00369 family)
MGDRAPVGPHSLRSARTALWQNPATMAFQSRDPDYERSVRESFSKQAVMATIGASLRSVEAGRIEIELPHRADLTQQHGFLHAGIVTTVLDSACGYAAFSLMPAGAGVLSVEFKVNLLAPAKGEVLIARGRVLRAGRTITVCQADGVMREGSEETPVATMLATIMTVLARPEVTG